MTALAVSIDLDQDDVEFFRLFFYHRLKGLKTVIFQSDVVIESHLAFAAELTRTNSDGNHDDDEI